MPEWLTIERAISIVSVAIAAAALLYIYYRYRRPPPEKALCIDQYGPLQTAGVSHATDAPIRIDYAGQRVQQVWRTLVLLWNRGNRPIEPDDFVVPITATCGPKGRMLACGVESVDLATNASVSFDRSMQKARVEVTVLRPGEAVVLCFDTDTEQARPNLTLHLQNADWIVKPSRRHGVDPRSIGQFVWWSLFLAGNAVFVTLMTDYTLWHAPLGIEELALMALLFVSVVAALPAVLGLAVTRSLRTIRRKLLSPVVYDFYYRRSAPIRMMAKPLPSSAKENGNPETTPNGSA